MRPIDADVLKNKSRHVFKSNTGGHCSPIVSTDDIDNTPTLTLDDIMPHGQWIDARKYCGDYMCSNCDALYGTDKFKYCPNCGAKMDGKE